MCDQQRLRPACAYAQSDQSLCYSLEYSMIVKLLTEHHLEFLSLKVGCRGSSKMPHCWKSHAMAHFYIMPLLHSACLGIGYGLLLNNRPLIQINTVAAFCVGIYLMSFVYVSQSKVGQDFRTYQMSHKKVQIWLPICIPVRI